MKKELLSPRFQPPERFRPAGDISSVYFSPTPPPFLQEVVVKGKRRDGIRYEEKGQQRLLEARPLTYAPSPWLQFWEGAEEFWCQPDGLDIDIGRGIITIVEFKLSHTSRAWWQTRKLYEPVVRYMFAGAPWSYAILEFVKWFDPDTAFPEPLRAVKDLSFSYIKPNAFHFHIWNGRS
jgi:hypothetical protein